MASSPVPKWFLVLSTSRAVPPPLFTFLSASCSSETPQERPPEIYWLGLLQPTSPNSSTYLCKSALEAYKPQSGLPQRQPRFLEPVLCICCFPLCCDQIPDKRQLQEGILYFSLQFGWHPSWQERHGARVGTVCHNVSLVRKPGGAGREDTSTLLLSPFYSVQHQSPQSGAAPVEDRSFFS